MNRPALMVFSLLVAGPLWAQTAATNSDDEGPTRPVSASSMVSLEPSEQDKAWDNLGAQMQEVKTLSNTTVMLNPKPVQDLLVAARTFAMKYPDDPRAFDAIMLWAQVSDVMYRQHLPGAPEPAEVDATFDKLASDPKMGMKKQAQIRAMQIDRAIRIASRGGDDSDAQWKSIDDRLTAFAKQFGTEYSLDGHLQVMVLLRGEQLTLLASTDRNRYQATLQKLAHDPNPKIADMARVRLNSQKKMALLKTEPIDIKYTATDGQQVDLTKMRGKVVLIEYWATWSKPSLLQVPEILAAYQKYHDQGFEIVGISLDRDKAQMEAAEKQNGMVWPQYFDGKGWENEISRSYGIDTVPTLWLVNKKGMLTTAEGPDTLAERVAKLLAAP